MSRRLARSAPALVVAWLWWGAAVAAETAGSVVAISGQCFVQSEGKRVPLKLGDEVRVADVVDVPGAAKLKLRMKDGSVLSVAAGSQVTVAAYAVGGDGKRESAELTLGQGLLRAVVTAVDRPAPFEVKTAVGTAGVRSTDLFVEAQPGMTVVGVVSGSVALTGSGGAGVTIPAGSGASVEAGGEPSAPRVWRRSEFDALIARTELAERRPQPRPARPAAPREERDEQPPAAPTPTQPAYPGGGGYDQSPGGYPYPSAPGGGYGPGGGYPSYPGGGGGYTPPRSGGGDHQNPSGGGYQRPSGGGGYQPPSGSGRY